MIVKTNKNTGLNLLYVKMIIHLQMSSIFINEWVFDLWGTFFEYRSPP